MTQILSNLYIGGINEARDIRWLRRHHITHIVNCAEEIPNYHRSIRYINLNFDDVPSQYILGHMNAVLNFYQHARGNVLVHCHAGISRSSATIMYILMKLKKWDWKKAFRYLKARHPRAMPNPGFLDQLSRIRTT